MADPFAMAPDPAEEPADEAQTTNDAPTFKIKHDPSAYPVKITFKGGTGYGEPWLSHEFTSLREAKEVLYDAQSAMDLQAVLRRIRQVADFFTSSGSKLAVQGSAGSGRTKSQETGRSAPREAKEPPRWMGEPPSCDHGEMLYRTGEGRKGTWYAWMCPDRADDCDPEWRNPPKSSGRSR